MFKRIGGLMISNEITANIEIINTIVPENFFIHRHLRTAESSAIF